MGAGSQADSRRASMGSMILGQYLVASTNCSHPALHPAWHAELLPPSNSSNSSILEACLQAAGQLDYPLLLLGNTSSGTEALPPPASCWGVMDTWSDGSTAAGGGGALMTSAPCGAPTNSLFTALACGPGTLDLYLCGVAGQDTLLLLSNAVNVSSLLVSFFVCTRQ